MTLEQFWKILNSPLAILLLGSAIGFLFVKFIWEPLVARRLAHQKRDAFRQEVRFRLINIRMALKKPSWNYEFEVTGSASGGAASYIDPTYQSWALHALIYAGWGAKVFEDIYPLTGQLLEADTREAANEKWAELEETLSRADAGH